MEAVFSKNQCFPLLEKVSKDILEEFSSICERKSAGMNLKEKLKPLISSEGKSQKIELFFPFDPYLLKRSEHYIHKMYRFWTEGEEDEKQECEKETDSSSPYINDDPPHYNRKLKRRAELELVDQEYKINKKIKK